MHLPFDDHGIDDDAAIVGREELAQAHRARLGIDDDDGKMHRLRVVGVGRIVELGDLEAGRERTVGRQPRAVIGDVGDFGEAGAAIRAARGEVSLRVVHVGLGAIEDQCREALGFRQHLVGRAADRRAGDGGGARAPGSVAERDLVGVAFDDADVLDRQPEPVGRDLREGDVVALAVRVAASKHRRLAVAVHPDDRALPAAVQTAALGEVAARAGSGLVDEAGEAYSHQHALRAQRGLLAPERAIVGEPEQLLEQRGRIAGIVDAAARRRIGKIGSRDEVALADLDRVDPERAGAELDQPLVGPRRLGPPGTAVGVDRDRVGVNAAHAEMEVRRLVEARHGLRIGVAGNAGREIAEIAAERGERVDLHRDDAPVRGETHARLREVVARLRVGQHSLRPARRPLDGPAQLLRGPDDRRDLDGEMPLHAEAAADIGRDDADLVFGNSERVDREPAPEIVRLLSRGVERIAVAGRVVVAGVGARLHRIRGEPRVDQIELHDACRRGHRRFGFRAIAALDVEDEIGAEARMHEHGARLNRIAHVDDGIDLLVLHIDPLGGLLGAKPRLGNDGGDDIADMADFSGRESRSRRLVHRPAVAERHRMDDAQFAEPGALPILGGQHQEHAGARRRRGAIDPDDLRMRVRAAHERAPRRAGQRHVVDIAAAALDEADVFAPEHRPADVGRARKRSVAAVGRCHCPFARKAGAKAMLEWAPRRR